MNTTVWKTTRLNPIYVANFRHITASIVSAQNTTHSAVTATAMRAQQILLFAAVAILFSQKQPQHTNKTQLCIVVFTACNTALPVPVAARSKVWVSGRSPVEIVGSNPTGGMDVCLV